MLQLLIVQLGRTLSLAGSYRCQLCSSLATSQIPLGVWIFSMNIRGWRGGEQRASLQTLSGLEENLGLGLEQHLWGWVLLTAAKGTGQQVLVCHPWASGAERVPRASLVL